MSKKKKKEGKVHVFLIIFAIAFAALAWCFQYGNQIKVVVSSPVTNETVDFMFKGVTTFFGGKPVVTSGDNSTEIALETLREVPLVAVAYYALFFVIGLNALGIFFRGKLKDFSSITASIIGVFVTVVLFSFPTLFKTANSIEETDFGLLKFTFTYGPSLIIAAVCSLLATSFSIGTCFNSR